MSVENLEQLLQQAKPGDVQAQNNLGLLYLNGDNLTQDVEQAWYWFNEAAKKGFEEARLNLGQMYQQGLIKDFSDEPENATPLAQRLMQLRREALVEGMPLLNSDEVNEEVRRRRVGD